MRCAWTIDTGGHAGRDSSIAKAHVGDAARRM